MSVSGEQDRPEPKTGWSRAEKQRRHVFWQRQERILARWERFLLARESGEPLDPVFVYRALATALLRRLLMAFPDDGPRALEHQADFVARLEAVADSFAARGGVGLDGVPIPPEGVEEELHLIAGRFFDVYVETWPTTHRPELRVVD
jgi:hypothetical protein